MKKTGTLPLLVLLTIVVLFVNYAEARQGGNIEEPSNVKPCVESVIRKTSVASKQKKTSSMSQTVDNSVLFETKITTKNEEIDSSDLEKTTSIHLDRKSQPIRKNIKEEHDKYTWFTFLQKLQKVFYYSTGLVSGS